MLLLIAVDDAGNVLDAKSGNNPFTLLQSVAVLRIMNPSVQRILMTDVEGNIIHEA